MEVAEQISLSQNSETNFSEGEVYILKTVLYCLSVTEVEGSGIFGRSHLCFV